MHHVFLKASLKIVKLVKLTILPVLLRNSIDFFKANTWYNWFKRRGKCHHYVWIDWITWWSIRDVFWILNFSICFVLTNVSGNAWRIDPKCFLNTLFPLNIVSILDVFRYEYDIGLDKWLPQNADPVFHVRGLSIDCKVALLKVQLFRY